MNLRLHVNAVLVTAAIAMPVAASCKTAEPMFRPMLPQDPVQDGIALYKQGKYAEAEAALRGASGTDASAYLAASLDKQKKYADAEAPAKAAVRSSPTHEVGVAALGESLVGQGKYDEALEKMSAAIAAKADLAYAYYWRGKVYNHKKQAGRMEEDFRTFVKLAPDAPEAQAVRQLLAGLK